MKNLKLAVVALALVMGVSFTAQAQAPYKHSIGATVGSMNAFSWKTFCDNHFAIQIDAGSKFTMGAFRNSSNCVYTAEANANFMYQGYMSKKLYGFIGGGPSLGYCWNQSWEGWHYRHDIGKFGVNAIFGLELKISAPVTFQWDFRPGYGMLFNENWTSHYFDWGLNFGVRYTF